MPCSCIRPAFADPERVVAIRVSFNKLKLRNIGVSAPDLGDVRDNRRLFEHAALWKKPTSTTAPRGCLSGLRELWSPQSGLTCSAPGLDWAACSGPKKT